MNERFSCKKGWKYFCPQCGWEGMKDETVYDKESKLFLCPKCDNILEYEEQDEFI